MEAPGPQRVDLSLYNVRTRSLEGFKPMQPGKVAMYVCGLTVYDHAHIGHARTAVAFEVIRRWLERDHEVHFVQNVTDVEDKIINRAKELGVSPRKHSAKWDADCVEQMTRLGVRQPDEAPHVTDSIPDIIAFIEGIVENGFAYATGAGNVYFDVPKYEEHAQETFPECGYGSLSNRDYREMAAGTRKDVEDDKQHPADFALWKTADEEDHPDANWDSPWGRGRPGWHIECSLMSTRALGDRIDIHGGGQDLIFPHHENEIAQSQAKTGAAPFVNVWMHTGFLNVEGEKMSKSLGNYITLREMLDELEADGRSAEALRFYFIQTHYRSKIDFSRRGLAEAAKGLAKLRRTRLLLWQRAAEERIGRADVDPGFVQSVQTLEDDFAAAMHDDIATPEALAAIFRFQRRALTALDQELGSEAAERGLAALQECGRLLTLFDDELASGASVPESVAKVAAALDVPLDGADTEEAAMQVLLDARERARKEKQWDRADSIRDQLAAAGYDIQDTAGGPRWSRA